MGLKVTVRVSGDQIVYRRLRAIGDGINDLSLVMRDIGQEAIRYYASTGFTDHGRPFGASWPDYSIQYKKWKEKKYAGRPMLVLTGDMQGGFFAKSTRSSVVIDNKEKYYKYHQSSAPRTKMPYRPMAGINGNITDIVKTKIREDIIKKLRLA